MKSSKTDKSPGQPKAGRGGRELSEFISSVVERQIAAARAELASLRAASQRASAKPQASPPKRKPGRPAKAAKAAPASKKAARATSAKPARGAGKKQKPAAEKKTRTGGGKQPRGSAAKGSAARKAPAPEPRKPAAKAAHAAPHTKAEKQKTPAPAKASRGPLDMSCRVAGCPNRSRGPRAGYICDEHRKTLSPEQQQEARALYNARKSGAPQAAIAKPGQSVARPPQAATPAPAAPPVPPIESKKAPPSHAVASHAPAAPSAPPPVGAAATAPERAATPVRAAEPPPPPAQLEDEPEDAPDTRPAAPAGSNYVLTVERARLIEVRRLGATLDVRFAVSEGPLRGCTAQGQFPLAGRGLPVFALAALGVPIDLTDATFLNRIEGTRVLADAVANGNPNEPAALVRNIRPLPPQARA